MTGQRPKSPTQTDLLNLPRWACVALAARCARRVQPSFARWAGASSKDADAVDHAIATSEASARAGRADASPCDAASKAAIAVHMAAAATACFATTEADNAAACAAASAAHAAGCAANTAFLAEVDPANVATGADGAVYSASSSSLDPSGDSGLPEAIWSDYDRLLTLATAEAWNDDTPVDVDRLGPL